MSFPNRQQSEKLLESGVEDFLDEGDFLDESRDCSAEHFGELKDPRAQHRIEFLLIDIVLITICVVICGTESWVDIEN